MGIINNNQIKLLGYIVGDVYEHEYRGIDYWRFPLEVKRSMGNTTDVFPCQVRKDILLAPQVGDHVGIRGTIRSCGGCEDFPMMTLATDIFKTVPEVEWLNEVILNGKVYFLSYTRRMDDGSQSVNAVVKVPTFGREVGIKVCFRGKCASVIRKAGLGANVVVYGAWQSRKRDGKIVLEVFCNRLCVIKEGARECIQ